MDPAGYDEPDLPWRPEDPLAYGEPEPIWPEDPHGYIEPELAWPEDSPGYIEPGPAHPAVPSAGPPGLGRASEAPRLRWYLTLARRSWPAATGACAVVTVIVISVMHIVSQQSPRPRAMMTDCRRAPCHTALRATAHPSARVSAHMPSATLSPTPSSPAAPEPSSPAPAAMAAVTSPVNASVSYHVLSDLLGTVVGKFTIVNDSGIYITGWQLSALFPGDQVVAVSGAHDPDLGSDLLIMDAPAQGSGIPPGGSISAIFVTQGHKAHPATCTFDGIAC